MTDRLALPRIVVSVSEHGFSFSLSLSSLCMYLTISLETHTYKESVSSYNNTEQKPPYSAEQIVAVSVHIVISSISTSPTFVPTSISPVVQPSSHLPFCIISFFN